MKKRYEQAVQEYILAFCLKHEIDFDYWVAGNIGGVAGFAGGEVYLNFDDIRFDIDTNQPAELIICHYWDSIENHPKEINFRSYAKGLRYDS